MSHKTPVCVTRFGLYVTLAMIIAVLLVPGNLRAQQSDQQNESTAVDAGEQTAPTQPSSIQTPPTQTVNSDADPALVQQDPQQRNVVSVATGSPLRALMSPLHWGHLSIMSASLLGAYDSNFQMSHVPVGAQETFFNTLFVYSIQHHRSQFSLQYMPSVWAADGHMGHDFTAQALSFQESHPLSRNWNLNLNDIFSYMPYRFSWTTIPFSPDFSNATATANPFVLIGRKAWLNTFSAGVSGTLNARNQLSFQMSGNFIRESPIAAQNAGTSASVPLLTDQQYGGTGTLTWTRTLNTRSSFNVSYSFQREYEESFRQNTTYQSVELGYSRRLGRSFSFSIGAGPGWSRQTRTVQGDVSLFKCFRRGGVAVSAGRGTNFTGLISNSYNNRYDVTWTEQLRRWELQASYSYVHQAFLNLPHTNVGIVYANLGYRLTRSWSLYSAYYYMNSTTGNQSPYGPRHVLAGGIRWAWSPEHGR